MELYLYFVFVFSIYQKIYVQSHEDHDHAVDPEKPKSTPQYILTAKFADTKLTSPNYPDPYDNNTDISWYIKAANERHVIVLSIDFISIAPGDSLVIYDGYDTFSPALKYFSGVYMTNVSSIRSSGDVVMLELNTNNDKENGRGFQLRYHEIDPHAQILIAQKEKQILVSPNFSDSSVIELSYMVTTTSMNHVIVVNFTKLNISQDDSIILYDDTVDRIKKIVNIYDEIGKIMKSYGQHMYIQMTISPEIYKGFQLEYFLDTINNSSYRQDVCFPSPCAVTHVCKPWNKLYMCECPENLIGPYCDIRCDQTPGDITFILDSSRSISSTNWNKILKFVVNVVSNLEVNDDMHRISVISFADNATINIHLDDHINDTDSLVSKIETLPFMNGKTNLSGAIRLMTDSVFNPSRGDREDVANIGIIITDGFSTIDNVLAKTEASRAKFTENITLFAIGIGDRIQEKELNSLANKPFSKYSLKVDDFDALGYLKKTILLVTCTKQDVSALVGKRGHTGATGQRGPTGDKGEPGIDSVVGGIPGGLGDTGFTGPEGESRSPGVSGRTGSLGSTGYTGPKGPDGDPGPHNNDIGAAGSVGEIGIGGIGVTGKIGGYGATGFTGFKGQPGNRGNPGTIHGTIGISGPTGPQGQQGIPGPFGTQGYIGDVGPRGLPGPMGPRGPPVVFSDGNQCNKNYVKQCDHICVDLPVGYMCECKEGYMLDSDKHKCIDIDECEDWNGGCDQFCHNTEGSRFCTCGTGFTLSLDTKSCLDIDECCSSVIIPDCDSSEHCVNTFGSYVCISKKIAYFSSNNTPDRNGNPELHTKSRLLENNVFMCLMIWMGSLTVISFFTLAYILLSDDGPALFNARSIQITPERYRRMTSKEAHEDYIFPRMNLGESTAIPSSDNVDAGEVGYRKGYSYSSRAPVEKRKLSREDKGNIMNYFDDGDAVAPIRRKPVVTIQEPRHI